jgi:hypothetical protein
MRYILLWTFLAVALPLRAQLRPSIDLTFEFQPAGAVSLPETAELQNTIATNLSADLYKAVPLWSPRPTTAGSAAPRFEIAALKDGFSEDAPWKIEARLVIRGSQAGSLLSETLFKPGDYQLVKPKATNWSNYIQRAFGREILARHPDEIKSLLARVPLGSGVVLTDRPPLSDVCIVLPLDWETFKTFSRSRFRIDCDSDGGLVTLHCVGLQKRFDFTPQQPRFPGLVAMITERQRGDKINPFGPNDLAEFSLLKPVRLYLTTVEETSELESAEGIQ